MATMNSIPYEQLNIGDRARYHKTLTEQDVLLFAHTSGDRNPVHLDEAYARTTPFKGRIAHGMWSASLISAALATVLPGPGSIYLGQTLRFLRPVRIGDRLTVELEVTGKQDEKRRVTLACRVLNQDGKVVVEGEAEVIPPPKAAEVDAPELPGIHIGDG